MNKHLNQIWRSLWRLHSITWHKDFIIFSNIYPISIHFPKQEQTQSFIHPHLVLWCPYLIVSSIVTIIALIQCCCPRTQFKASLATKQLIFYDFLWSSAQQTRNCSQWTKRTAKNYIKLQFIGCWPYLCSFRWQPLSWPLLTHQRTNCINYSKDFSSAWHTRRLFTQLVLHSSHQTAVIPRNSNNK